MPSALVGPGHGAVSQPPADGSRCAECIYAACAYVWSPQWPPSTPHAAAQPTTISLSSPSAKIPMAVSSFFPLAMPLSLSPPHPSSHPSSTPSPLSLSDPSPGGPCWTSVLLPRRTKSLSDTPFSLSALILIPLERGEGGRESSKATKKIKSSP